MIRTTAAALDAATGSYDVAVLARVHISALAALLAGHELPREDDFASILAALRAP